MANQLSLIRCFDGFHLVNSAGAKIQLQSTGWLLYLPAFPVEAGFSNAKGATYQQQVEACSMTKAELRKHHAHLQGELVNIAFLWRT